jgi:hypothetical protein
MTAMPVEPFSIKVQDEVLSDLRARLRNTRWPDQVPDAPWRLGTDLDYLKQLVVYWADGFDWRSRERELNAFDQFRAELDGVHIHFVHHLARRGNGIPLILTHGWPSTFVEMLPLVPFLTDPEAHGIDGPAFDVVIPSLPGYGFSERPLRTGVTTRYTPASGTGSCADSGMSATEHTAPISGRLSPPSWRWTVRAGSAVST